MPRDEALAPPGGPFASHALRLADLGYSPIPLRGKRPFLDVWQRHREPDLDRIAAWAREYPACNVGIVCHRVVGVDMDVLDPDLAHRLDALAVARLGEGPLRIGQYPKRLRVFRVTEPLGKLKVGAVKGAQVEVLATGQQFAAYGVHPDTGRPYTWPDGDLTEWAAEDLPQVTPDALRRFVAEAEPLLPRMEDAPARARARAGGVARGGGEAVRGADGRVVDGRDAYLSTLAFHAVHDAVARGAAPDADALAAVVWDRFRDTAALGDAKGTGRAWTERDALRKVRDKLRLHSAGALPPRTAGTDAAEPAHPLPRRTRDEARAEVRRHVHGFLGRALEWHARPEAARGAPEHAGIAVEVAAGKTRISCEALPGFVAEAKARGLPHRVLFLVPTHRLGLEVMGRLARLGLRAAAWRGREAKLDPEAPDGSALMCGSMGAVEDALAALQDVEEAACGKGAARCPLHAGCAFQRQKAAAAAADVVVAAHEVMLGRLTEAVGRGFAAVVADEGWLFDGVNASHAVTVETLRAGEADHPVLRQGRTGHVDEEATDSLHVWRRRLADAVEASPDGYLTRAALEGAGLTAADCAAAGGLEWRRKVEDALRPGMPAAARREAKRRCEGNAAIPRLSALWKAAGALLEDGGEATGRVEIAARETQVGTQRVLLVHTVRAVADAVAGLPMLLLDATMPTALLRHRLPRLEVLAEVRAEAPRMRFHHVLGGFGKTSLAPHPEAADEENRRRLARIAGLRDFILLRTGGARALVVTYEGLEAHFAGLPGVETAHFNALAGRDEWGPQPGRPGVRHLFVIGRPQPSPEDTRRLAAALTGRPVPAEVPGRVARGATMRDGSGAGVPVRAYADPDLEAVLQAITVAELVQAIGRGRGINRTEADPLDAYLLAGDVVVPLPVDTLTRWPDVEPDLFGRMAARGVVLTSPSDAVRAYPDLFPGGEGAARQALSRAGRGGDFRDISLWRLPIGKCHGNPPPAAWVRVEYRPPGRGQQTRTAWARPDRLPSLRAWLEKAAGAAFLPHYEVAAVPEASVEAQASSAVPTPAAPGVPAWGEAAWEDLGGWCNPMGRAGRMPTLPDGTWVGSG